MDHDEKIFMAWLFGGIAAFLLILSLWSWWQCGEVARRYNAICHTHITRGDALFLTLNPSVCQAPVAK